MKIYNTLTRTKEEFQTVEPGKVKMYVCGPTVYNFIHIGNARPMVVFDTVRRYLEYKGYEVTFVSNFTDVDDKIIHKAREEGIEAGEVAKRFIAECKKDMEGLHVRPASVHPLATQEIDGMVDMIRALIDKGHAYAAADGTVYFRCESFEEYGKLSHKHLEDMQGGRRQLQVTGEEQKESPLDFVLWKPKKEGEPYWDAPWCQGRPGWHIECSVMSKKYLGDTMDIHAGGEDLIFPHHENEIAQSESLTGKPMAKYWMHNAFLNIDHTKMSKSKGNFVTVRDIAEQYDLQLLRFFLLSAHYRSPLNFGGELMEAAKNALERITTCVENLRYLIEQGETQTLNQSEAVAGYQASEQTDVQPVDHGSEQTDVQPVDHGSEQTGVQPVDHGSEQAVGYTSRKAGDLGSLVGDQSGSTLDVLEDTAVQMAVSTDEMPKSFLPVFEAAMEDDFNTADAEAALFELVKYANTNGKADKPKAYLEALYQEILLMADILGLVVTKEKKLVPEEVERLIEERKSARKAKDFARADEIRQELLTKGILLEDTREGVKWKYKE
jgi:cysteinyl-tRNA synthetase